MSVPLSDVVKAELRTLAETILAADPNCPPWGQVVALLDERAYGRPPLDARQFIDLCPSCARVHASTGKSKPK